MSGSVEGVGAELTAAEAILPHDQVAAAIDQLTEAQAGYTQALEGSGAEEEAVIYGGLAQALTSLAEAQGALRQVSESTARYLAAIGFSGEVQGFNAGSAPGPGEARQPGRPMDYNDVTGGRPHAVARTEINKQFRRLAESDLGLTDIARVPVADHQVSWDVVVPEYDPPFIDMPFSETSEGQGAHEGAADPADPRQIEHFTSIITNDIKRDKHGRPRNPMGRTGIQGRGVLNKWGETLAADVILTRNNPETGELEVAAVQRSDTGEWALPGGGIEPGETPEQAAVREFAEEAGGMDAPRLDLSNARTVYAGYVDDSRNTDNAWMASTFIHKHLSPDEAQSVRLQAGSDAIGVKWTSPRGAFFASHGRVLRRALGISETESDN